MTISDLPVGAKLKERDSGLVFLIAGHEHPGYEGTTLLADNVIAQACFDAPEERNPDERLRITGSNNYRLSNLHVWLNSEGGGWYSPSHEYDAPPSEEALAQRPNAYDRHGYNAYDGKPGFLSWFGEGFRGAILESQVPCLSGGRDGIEYIKAKVFLPSAEEAGIRTHEPVKEGVKLAVMDDFRMRFATPSPEALVTAQFRPAYFNAGQLFWYWLRTPHSLDPGFVCYAHNTNPYSYKFACCPWMGVRPMLNIDPALAVTPSRAAPGLFLV
jgi:hypothetical protein